MVLPWAVILATQFVLVIAAGGGAAPPAAVEPQVVAPASVTCAVGEPGALATRLRGGIGPERWFGLAPEHATWVLYPVTQERALPASYVPLDLIWTTAGGSAAQGSQPVRRLIVPDLEAMFAAARDDGAVMGILSGYRSYDTQAGLFSSSVRQWLSRGVEREEAEARANRFRARAGHSQHQLGTTVDLTTPEIGNGLGQQFGVSRAGRWLAVHAAEYGFVVPYTAEGEPRTGYAAEPWHLRWVGRELAALMQADDYLSRADLVADDYLVALDLLLADRVPPCTGGG